MTLLAAVDAPASGCYTVCKDGSLLERTDAAMCPPDTPPAIFDVTAPHSSGLVLLWWLAPPLCILIPVWGNRLWLRWAAGFFSISVAIFAVALEWMDATNYWFASQPDTCIGIHLLNVQAQMFFLQDGILIGACLLWFVALFIYLFAFQRYQRARAAAGRVIL
jgi:hypothetical protein